MSLPSSMADFVPCDHLLQKAYYHSSQTVGFFLFFPGGFKVFFVALGQSFSHYNNVAQKLVSTNLFICYLFLSIIYLFDIRFYFSLNYTFITKLTSCQSTNNFYKLVVPGKF